MQRKGSNRKQSEIFFNMHVNMHAMLIYYKSKMNKS